jgi:hypothetical protein
MEGNLEAVWNGEKVVFVSQLVGDPEYPELELSVTTDRNQVDVARKISVFPHEGGIPELVAIGFANADADKSKELIVIVSWSVRHYDVSGTMYEVQIYDDWSDSPSALQILDRVSQRFGLGCECWRRGEADEKYRYQTVSAVKKELNRLGY